VDAPTYQGKAFKDRRGRPRTMIGNGVYLEMNIRLNGLILEL
jgi:hypothetical protein